MACGYSWGFSSCDFLHAHPFQLPGIILNVTSTKCTSCVLLSWCNVAPQRENERAFVKQEEQLTTVSISYLWRRMSGNNKELSKSNREIKSLENNKTKKATSVQTNFNIRGSTCCDPCWHCTQSHSTMPLVSELGRGPKPQYISAMEHLFPFRGGGGVYAGPQHAPTFFCPATLHDSLFWEAQVGTWDTKLTKHSLSLQWGQLVPWECRWPCNATRWTTLRHISWQSAKRGISCLHNFIFTGGGKKSSMQSLNVRLLQERVPTQITERA